MLLMILILIGLGMYFVSRFFENSLVRKSAGTREDSRFSIYFDESYVVDPNVGRYPGVNKQNKGSEEFSDYNSNPEKRAEIFNNYKLFVIDNILDLNTGRVTVTDSGIKSDRSFECSSDRTAAFTNINQIFISSGFDFMKTAIVGDMVFTKCKNDDCSILGPDCIIVKERP
ncbi:MAG: hypothetical protein UW13_C0003G0052 [candidate division WWE3 bacterium GW2011_GWA1_43_94]|nr:MAG: hypothetical protein UV21_C0003G0052 [candidate division WWE3 bacterium GW2011_GWD2_42_34]KKT27465.1 MAG: hypothetical protein UW13_C0003G0052 [candidate division WWE3 bacterium GW2011_GWA1_43_94]